VLVTIASAKRSISKFSTRVNYSRTVFFVRKTIYSRTVKWIAHIVAIEEYC
jgi:hypothetical protein